MVVGICRISFMLPGNSSLKGKRSVVRKILDRSRNRFNVAMAEVAEMDLLQRAVIGFAVVSNDSRHANSMLDKIATFISSSTEAIMVDKQLELVHLSDQRDHFEAGSDLLDRKFSD